MTETIIGYILTGTAAAAAVKILDNVIMWILARRAAKSDKKEGKKTSVEKKVDSLIEANRMILFDRIQYLGQAYIRCREIDFDDRRRLHEMHGVYHDKLDGNGDLDVLMKQVDTLPLKGGTKS